MGVYAIKPAFQNLLSPVAKLCVKMQIHPDIINFLGLFVSVLMAVSIFTSNISPLLYLFLPVGAFLRTAFNALDGMVARGLSLSSNMGEVYNEFIDRVSDSVIFLTLGFSKHGHSELALLSIVLILLCSYLGILGKASGGSRVFAGVLGKADRMILLGIMGILSFCNYHYWNIFYITISIGTAITIIQRFMIIKEEFKNESNK